jgi:hypothetical protein
MAQPANDLLENSLANVSISSQSYNPDVHSPSDMVVDTDDYVGVPNQPEKERVTIINPENLENEGDTLQDLPMANDSMP